MRWYKKLFWKVFAAIWIVSFLALVATVQLVSTLAEKEKFDAVITAKAMGYVELMVERYELNGYRQLPGLMQSFREEDHSRRFAPRPPRISKRVEIVDQLLGQAVVINPLFEGKTRGVEEAQYTSDSGREYLVRIDLNWQGSPVENVLRRLLSLQVVLIILVSGLCAWVISSIIVRPLNQLRQHSQAIYQGQLDSRTDKAVSDRGDEIGELARDFNRMADYVQLTLNAQQKLLQDVSHELRAPLARLQAAAGLAEQRWGEEDKIVSRLNRETGRLDGLIGEILSLSRLEQMEVRCESYALNQWLIELVEDIQFSYPSHPIQTEVVACRCELNPRLLERALSNILVNACKHTQSGTVIEIALQMKNTDCEIIIRDHGEGVSADELAHLCEPFYRGGASNKGYGLGLSIAYRALARLGATLVLENHAGGGLQARIKLPCL
ncbi:HAMP domain-containing sensor histidine kinase [Neptuniibacter sp. CAU 1671]|uniref:sensor histidine kinase n=1 Tax=Neptuniibacter sp. CAU 1671 TaxID=3032593 RepID=UPI0023DB057C|nr:HAMP domain-containing sensor histidine kinase [Neptuniibacter sp. CAU 1671]MDF2182535.1 HAMP domain-containing sensor histidine kinase [Neptuniibacter sp. CAU 1671]